MNDGRECPCGKPFVQRTYIDSSTYVGVCDELHATLSTGQSFSETATSERPNWTAISRDALADAETFLVAAIDTWNSDEAFDTPRAEAVLAKVRAALSRDSSEESRKADLLPTQQRRPK